MAPVSRYQGHYQATASTPLNRRRHGGTSRLTLLVYCKRGANKNSLSLAGEEPRAFRRMAFTIYASR